jgi:PAS domain-containing protein
MYKLTIISGPNRGSSYILTEGDSSVGRQMDNTIAVSSSRVSKRHCVFSVRGEEVTVRDQRSANGTYVNGALVQSKVLHAGDRVSVGNVVFELRRAVQRAISDAPAAALMASGSTAPVVDLSAQDDAMPQDLPGRVRWVIEKFVWPFFYNLVLRYQWRSVLGGTIVFLLGVSLFATIQPMLDSAQGTILEELKRKAQLVARQIVDLNQGQIQLGGGESKARAGVFELEDGVRFAVVSDLELRVLAPEAKVGRRISTGDEARLALLAAKLYLQGQSGGVVRVIGGETVVAVEPILALDPRKGKNVVVAMAVVSLDATMSRPEWGQIGIIYSQALLILGLSALLVFAVIYRITLKPLEVLNEDIDKVLKGELGQVTREFKWEEISSLVDVVNAALQRIPMNRGTMGSGEATSAPVNLGDYATLFSAMGQSAKAGVVVCNAERKIVYMNQVFEELSGIHADQARGEDLRTIARDQALGAMANDLFDRAHGVSGELVQEDFDFSGIAYKMTAALFGGGEAKGFVLLATKAEGA